MAQPIDAVVVFAMLNQHVSAWLLECANYGCLSCTQYGVVSSGCRALVTVGSCKQNDDVNHERISAEDILPPPAVLPASCVLGWLMAALPCLQAASSNKA